jgi:hypothetical protein
VGALPLAWIVRQFSEGGALYRAARPAKKKPGHAKKDKKDKKATKEKHEKKEKKAKSPAKTVDATR